MGTPLSFTDSAKKYWEVVNGRTDKFVSTAETKVNDFKAKHPQFFRITLAITLLAINIIKAILAPLFFSIGCAVGILLGLIFNKQVEMIKKSAHDIYNSANGMGKIGIIIGVAAWVFADPGMAPGLAIGAMIGSQTRTIFNASTAVAAPAT